VPLLGQLYIKEFCSSTKDSTARREWDFGLKLYGVIIVQPELVPEFELHICDFCEHISVLQYSFFRTYIFHTQ
jgi:hypothetical protein